MKRRKPDTDPYPDYDSLVRDVLRLTEHPLPNLSVVTAIIDGKRQVVYERGGGGEAADEG